MKKILYFLRDLFWKNKLKKIVGIVLYIVVLFVILVIVAPKHQIQPRTREVLLGTEEAYHEISVFENFFQKKLEKTPKNTEEYYKIEWHLNRLREAKKRSEEIRKLREQKNEH